MGAKVIVRWLRPCALHVPTQQGRLVLAPGDNEIPAEQWAHMCRLPAVRKRLDRRLLVEVPRSTPDPDAPALADAPMPRGMAATMPEVSAEPDRPVVALPVTEPLPAIVNQAMGVIEACTDLAVLRTWGKSETRSDVQRAIVARYYALGGKA
jgi:hypothetical protein